jgi:type VI secretion system ImpM family protein
MIPAPSCLGKLPLHGDFLRIRVNQVQKAKLDAWFAMLGKANHQTDGKGATVTPSATPWCFVMRGGLLGASNQLMAIGVLFDSFDKIGRGYPFIMYQLVPKRWLVNQLKEPQNWLYCLQQFAQGCLGKDSAEIDTMLHRLWSIYKPDWLDYFKAPRPAQRRNMSRQAEQLLQIWYVPNNDINEDIGVALPPWSDWPHNLTQRATSSVWWQLDDVGRYLDCIEHARLDKTLIEQLLIRPDHV